MKASVYGLRSTVFGRCCSSRPCQHRRRRRNRTRLRPGNAEAGKKLFVSYGCYQCHGYEAQGSNATGPRLGPRPIAFAAFSRYVRQPTGQMPPYTAKVVSDADLTNIYAFVSSRPAPAANIPLLK